MVRVLATRHLPGPGFDRLPDVEVAPLASMTAVRADVEAVISINEPVPLPLLPNLRLVANYGVGVDKVDLAGCAQRGIIVTNTPDVLTQATADLTFALILATRRRVVEGDRLVRAGKWPGNPSSTRIAEDVSGSTLGIIGLGRIGSAVAERARAFHMRVLYHQNASLDTELGEFRDLEALLSEADIVTIHAPLTEQTRGLIGVRELGLLRDGACVINAARGPIIDEEALVAELISGRLRAGLDVFTDEPHVPPALLDLPNVVLTPHLGSNTRQTREAMTDLVVDNILAVANGRPPLTPVA